MMIGYLCFMKVQQIGETVNMRTSPLWDDSIYLFHSHVVFASEVPVNLVLSKDAAVAL